MVMGGLKRYFSDDTSHNKSGQLDLKIHKFQGLKDQQLKQHWFWVNFESNAEINSKCV